MLTRSDRVVPWLLIGPAVLALAVFFALPLVMLLSGSVQRLDPATFAITDRLTLFNYRRFLFDEFYLGVLL
jgi:ABC-type spermidine/putrescine transport system permease subunit I